MRLLSHNFIDDLTNKIIKVVIAAWLLMLPLFGIQIINKYLFTNNYDIMTITFIGVISLSGVILFLAMLWVILGIMD